MSLYSTQLLPTSFTHAWSLSHAFDSAWVTFCEVLTKATWSPALRLFERNITSILSRVSIGEITLITKDGKCKTFGTPSADGLRATITVTNDVFWVRVGLFTDLGLAESFLYGDIDIDDVTALIKILILNAKHLEVMNSVATQILDAGRSLTASRFIGNLTNSRANISAHYDIGNAMFEAYLSEDMNYSSALFLDIDEDLAPSCDLSIIESLESAQLRKMRYLIRKLQIRPGDRILEIGTGWGSLSILMAQTVECTIDTVTLSVEQATAARKRITSAGLSDRITVHDMDFRECRAHPDWQGAFDRFISVEMMEHVGKQFFEEYWAVADWALKPDTGVGVVQVITLPEARTPSYDKNVDFIQKWSNANPFMYNHKIFPGGYLPSLCMLIDTMRSATSGKLTVDSVSNIGQHYARTLREWERRFCTNWETHIQPALKHKYTLKEDDLEIFRRKWLYYL
ncbi:hypothetical protein HGRIS_006756 [Hohenbuehelia grisea]|uniref:Cyclopropane-fatty-acyl-phospholipid synthase n=1 Tax=Hohenbuehelia grisea TaxID=104357 RepID=A0ABR3JAM0_9AGAR